MPITNAKRQLTYRQRAASSGLVRLQVYVERDIDALIDDIATRLKKPRYAVIEFAIQELVKKYRLAESEQKRLSQGETYKTIAED
ncbi:hypothetical protein SAMN05421880_11766 [Nitrosomonas nitrosa]|uniref:Ribbon-helix-helix domain-containing protein n=1 Tax=Nitrosomonas nitrosa TaxID=52442 RepID=A0A1I4R4T0_9PROT|nr:hypothetical protein [Nitrosomonas nitrosa]SFM47145.1 hypothetical protein SAMN05421880_11766 [Nitrosomonas nitrosa]